MFAQGLAPTALTEITGPYSVAAAWIALASDMPRSVLPKITAPPVDMMPCVTPTIWLPSTRTPTPMMSTPRVATHGSGHGKSAIGAYWRRALAGAPGLRFELLATFLGADCVVLHYQGVRGPAAEVFFFDADGRVTRAAASYL